MTPQTQQQWRRAFRTGIYCVTILAAIGFIGWIIYRADDMTTLQIIATGLLGIVLVSVLGYTAENVTQRINFKAGPTGVSGSIDPGKAAQEVADAAQEEADTMK